MTSFFDDLESQLRAAARARTGAAGAPTPPPRRRRRWAWLRAGLRAAPVLIAVATTVIVAVAALALFGHGRSHGSSTPGSRAGRASPITYPLSPRERQELTYISKVSSQVLRSPACQVHQNGVLFVRGAPGHDLLSILGVLRRPATRAERADRIPPEYLIGEQDIYAGYERRALVSGGVTYYVVPARSFPAADALPLHCFALQKAALRRDLPRIPAGLRTATQALQAQLFAFAQKLESQAPRDVLCLISVGGNSSGAACGETAAAIRNGQAALQTNNTFSGVVPDGVASVTLHFPASAGHVAVTVTTTVTNNVFAVRLPGGARPSPMQQTDVWRSAQGRVLKTIRPPAPGAGTVYCKAHAIMCVAVSGLTAISSSKSGGSVASTMSISSTSTSAAAAPAHTPSKH